MIITHALDETYCDEESLNSQGFPLEPRRDVKLVAKRDKNTGDVTDQKVPVFNFVGFVTNAADDILLVFPKHYRVENEESDAKILFDCIAKFNQMHPDTFIGENSDEAYKSNFPFSAFWGIYGYYQKYGLYFNNEKSVIPKPGGKVSWKQTISKAQKFFIDRDLIMYPLYYWKHRRFTDFITECMIYAIDYTISKFNILVEATPTGQPLPEFNFFEERDYVVSTLCQMRQKVFNNAVQSLIDNLIQFFSHINVGGCYYLKHYKFSSIWEDMVTDYLCKNFKKIEVIDGNPTMIFDKESPSGLTFKKETFYVNEAKEGQNIQPDQYCAFGNTQMIIDSKYYSYVYGMRYKEIAYLYILKDMIDLETQKPKYDNIYAALVLPLEKRKTKVHFRLKPIYRTDDKVIIMEEYLDIKEVMLDYLNQNQLSHEAT